MSQFKLQTYPQRVFGFVVCSHRKIESQNADVILLFLHHIIGQC